MEHFLFFPGRYPNVKCWEKYSLLSQNLLGHFQMFSKFFTITFWVIQEITFTWPQQFREEKSYYFLLLKTITKQRIGLPFVVGLPVALNPGIVGAQVGGRSISCLWPLTIIRMHVQGKQYLAPMFPASHACSAWPCLWEDLAFITFLGMREALDFHRNLHMGPNVAHAVSPQCLLWIRFLAYSRIPVLNKVVLVP